MRIFSSAFLFVCLGCLAAGAGDDRANLRDAITDLARTYGPRYPQGEAFLKRLDALAADDKTGLENLRREALLANPLLDFERLLVVKRHPSRLGLPQNWQGNCALPETGYDNEIDSVPLRDPAAVAATVFRPAHGEFVGDLDLNWDGTRFLVSMPQEKKAGGRWRIWELQADGSGLRQVTPNDPEVDHYDACYLPDGRIVFGSTAGFQGVPCVGGGNSVANLYELSADGKTVRQLCYNQDHDWCPAVLNDGRVLYSRWEYTDTPHYFTRLLFTMNPDGSNQMAAYGSNSYWPNSIFYARAIPGHPSKVVAVISGHHGVPRMGELIVFDLARGRTEAAGVVQRIPGRNAPVEPRVTDQLVADSWPRFLHPWPLDEKHFLVSCQPRPDAQWGIYLADVFDNLVPVRTDPAYALLEPVPLKATTAPPVIPDRIKPGATEAEVFLEDVYRGPAMAGVPRGTVKKLRVFEYHYAYRRMGGHINIGVDGPWDVHRILGTVPVLADGSARFLVPSNTPLAVQPLDDQGRAVQVMRSWFTAQPGERVSCVGCHESANQSAAPGAALAALSPPAAIEPWRGPKRGFSFPREVQPLLDRKCVGCHNGSPSPNGQPLPDFTGGSGTAGKKQNGFDSSYLALHPFVRRPGPESDYHVPNPMEFAASTSELVQMLEKGHHGVKLEAEEWDRLVTWIDLNVPDHGTWGEQSDIPGKAKEQRAAFRQQYASITDDPEAYPTPPPAPVAFEKPPSETVAPPAPSVAGWPFDAAEAGRRQAQAGIPKAEKLDLGDGVMLECLAVPAGAFALGGASGAADERPVSEARVANAFLLGKCEVTNRQFALFDPTHRSGVLSTFNKDATERGIEMEKPDQPVVRVSWDEARAFCEWATARTGRAVRLPTEVEWEWACRAGADSPYSFGSAATDFAKFANLADVNLPAICRRDSPRWVPAVLEANDRAMASQRVGAYQPNAWGFHDMHGNVAEWTSSPYRPYPVTEAPPDPGARFVARGGSFYDRPARATASFRLAYPRWQRVFNVGFRVVCEAQAPKPPASAGK